MYRSRRWFLKTTGVAGAFLASRLRDLPSLALAQGPSSPCLLHVGSRYAPSIEGFLQQIRPGSDEFIAEKYAAELEVALKTWQQAFCASARDLRVVHDLLSENLDGSLLNRANVTQVRSQPPVQSDKVFFPRPERVSRGVFVDGLNQYLAPFKKIETAELQIHLIEIVRDAADGLRTQIHYDLVGELDANRRESGRANGNCPG